MPRVGRTAKSKLFIGHDGYLADPSPFIPSAWSVGVELASDVWFPSGEAFQRVQPIRARHTFSVPSVKYSAVSDMLQTHRTDVDDVGDPKNVAVALFEDTNDFLLMPVVFSGIPATWPDEGSVEHPLELLQADVGPLIRGISDTFDGVKATTVAWSSNSTPTVTVDTGDHIWLLATAVGGTGGTVQLAGSTTQTIATASIVRLGVVESGTSARLTVAGLSGGDSITGRVLAGKPVALAGVTDG